MIKHFSSKNSPGGGGGMCERENDELMDTLLRNLRTILCSVCLGFILKSDARADMEDR